MPRHGAWRGRRPDDGDVTLRRRQRNEAMRRENVRRPPRIRRAELADLVKLSRVVPHVRQRASNAREERPGPKARLGDDRSPAEPCERLARRLPPPPTHERQYRQQTEQNDTAERKGRRSGARKIETRSHPDRIDQADYLLVKAVPMCRSELPAPHAAKARDMPAGQ